jgi:hypothetical protein
MGVALSEAAMVAVTALLLASLLLGAVPPDVDADEASAYTARATVLCEQADEAPERQAEAMLQEGLRLAELAVEHNEQDARAHFALFCTLGKLIERRGVGLGSIRKVRRLQRVIDRTLELAPDYIAANIAKAELLSRLPCWLGGDAAEAHRYRARAMALQVEQSAGALVLDSDTVAAVEARRSPLVVTASADPDAGS